MKKKVKMLLFIVLISIIIFNLTNKSFNIEGLSVQMAESKLNITSSLIKSLTNDPKINQYKLAVDKAQRIIDKNTDAMKASAKAAVPK